MAKHANDPGTLDMLPTPKRRGRPPTGKAKTAAERMRAYRQRLASSSPAQQPKTPVQVYGQPAPDFPAWEAERQEYVDLVATLERRLKLVRAERGRLDESLDRLRNELAVTKSVLADVRADLRKAERRSRS